MIGQAVVFYLQMKACKRIVSNIYKIAYNLTKNIHILFKILRKM